MTLGRKGLQGIHIDTLKPKNSKSITFTVRGGFFTFWASLAHSVAPVLVGEYLMISCGPFSTTLSEDGKIQQK